MTAVDTNVWIPFISGENRPEVNALRRLIESGLVFTPPVVLTELSSDAACPAWILALLRETCSLPLLPGFWERTGQLRSRLRKRGLRPKLGDSLIAQFCLDHGLQLFTMDQDFQAFARHEGLLLAVP